jgi:hypothetical protein
MSCAGIEVTGLEAGFTCGSRIPLTIMNDIVSKLFIVWGSAFSGDNLLPLHLQDYSQTLPYAGR